MQIKDSKELLQAIERLNAKLGVHENEILNNIIRIKQALDPVKMVNNLLPRKVTVGETLNNLIDESIIDMADLVIYKLAIPSNNSFIKVAGNAVIKNSINMAVSKNAFKIKAISLAIVKNIFN